jgi:hypothetical protein
VISWGQIFYGAALTTVIAAVVLVFLKRERNPGVLIPALVASFVGPLTWNAILHRAATDADAFFIDIPFKPFPVSWQDTGDGIVTLARVALSRTRVTQRNREPSARPCRHCRLDRVSRRHLRLLTRHCYQTPLTTPAS